MIEWLEKRLLHRDAGPIDQVIAEFVDHRPQRLVGADAGTRTPSARRTRGPPRPPGRRRVRRHSRTRRIPGRAGRRSGRRTRSPRRDRGRRARAGSSARARWHTSGQRCCPARSRKGPGPGPAARARPRTPRRRTAPPGPAQRRVPRRVPRPGSSAAGSDPASATGSVKAAAAQVASPQSATPSSPSSAATGTSRSSSGGAGRMSPTPRSPGRSRSRHGTQSGARIASGPGSRTLSLTVTVFDHDARATVTAQRQPW